MHPAAKKHIKIKKKKIRPFIQSFLLFVFIFWLQLLLNVKLTTNICTLKQSPPKKNHLSLFPSPSIWNKTAAKPTLRPQRSERKKHEGERGGKKIISDCFLPSHYCTYSIHTSSSASIILVWVSRILILPNPKNRDTHTRVS